jgi:pSer/pThr/pTyr-binding forkhead associated (FHA) protein
MAPPLLLEAVDRPERFTILPGQTLVIGRTPGADLILPEITVGRRHVRITYTSDECTIEDAGSPCGTSLNHEMIRGPAEIRPGDVIRVGRVELRVRVGAASTP